MVLLLLLLVVMRILLMLLLLLPCRHRVMRMMGVMVMMD